MACAKPSWMSRTAHVVSVRTQGERCVSTPNILGPTNAPSAESTKPEASLASGGLSVKLNTFTPSTYRTPMMIPVRTPRISAAGSRPLSLDPAQPLVIFADMNQEGALNSADDPHAHCKASQNARGGSDRASHYPHHSTVSLPLSGRRASFGRDSVVVNASGGSGSKSRAG